MSSAGPEPFAYPPTDPGYPALRLEALLDAHATLLQRIKVCFGVDRETFEREVMTLVRRYAAFVHLLPATPDNYFSVPGGLLQLSLETAFFALQGTDAHIFSGRATITTRRHLEPRWRLATFIGGLCHELHRTVGRLIVSDQHGAVWPVYLIGLLPWLQTKEQPRYGVKWLPHAPPSPGFSLFALLHIVPAATLQHLAEDNAVVVPHLMASLTSSTLMGDHNILDQLVRRSAALVIDRFLREAAERSGKPQLGAHLERYLLDALRRLVATDPAWQPNAERSRVWLGTDGLFIIWPQAAADIGKLLDAEQLPGMPKAAETMQEILMRVGVLEARTDGQGLWLIHPPGSRAHVEAIKLSAAGLVLSGLHPQPVALPLALGNPTHTSIASAVPPAVHRASQPHPATVTDEHRSQTASRDSDRHNATHHNATNDSGIIPTVIAHSAHVPCGALPAPSLASCQDPSPQLELPFSSSDSASDSASYSANGAASTTVIDAADHQTVGPGGVVTSRTWADLFDEQGGADRIAAPAGSAPLTDAMRHAPSDPAISSSVRPSLALKAPMRLAPAVRHALELVISALNAQHASVAAQVTPTGLFVGLDALAERGVTAPAALRGVADAGMLETSDIAAHSAQAGPTTLLRIDDRDVRGLVIARSFIEGLTEGLTEGLQEGPLKGMPASLPEDPLKATAADRTL